MSRSRGKKKRRDNPPVVETSAPVETSSGADANLATPASDAAIEKTWPGWAKVVASLVILFHLIAVIIAPLTMLMPSPSLTVPIRNQFAPYQQATYLDHGYQFFAPDPGPSHFVQYIVITNQGDRFEGRFPDRDQHWPRLHYHRWFMLAERLYAINDQILSDQMLKDILADLDRQIAEANKNSNSEAARYLAREKRLISERNLDLRRQSARLANGIHHQLLRIYDARSIDIYCVERSIPAPYHITTERKSLDDDQFLPVDRRIKLMIAPRPNPQAEEIK